MATQERDYLQHPAELLDCAGNLIEVAGEKMLRSRELSALVKEELILPSRELIMYTKQRIIRSTVRLGTQSGS